MNDVPLPMILVLLFPIFILSNACGQSEICDWEDNDKDGIIDEGFDADGDGHWACGITEVNYEAGNYDCDDEDPARHPQANERCDDIDNNCDGIIDDGCAAFVLESTAPVIRPFITDLDEDERFELTVINGGFDFSDLSISVLDFKAPYEKQWESSTDWAPGVEYDVRSGHYNRFLIGFPGGIIPVEFEPDEFAVLDINDAYLLWPETQVWPLRLANFGETGALISAAIGLVEEVAHLHHLKPFGEGYEVVAEYDLPDDLTPLVDLHMADLNGDGVDEVLLICKREIMLFRLREGGGFEVQGHLRFEENVGQVALAHGRGDSLPELYISLPEIWQILEYENNDGLFLKPPNAVELIRNPLGIAGIDIEGDGDLDLAISDGISESLVLWESVDGQSLNPTPCTYATGPHPNRLETLVDPRSGDSKLAVFDDENYTLMIIDEPCAGQ